MRRQENNEMTFGAIRACSGRARPHFKGVSFSATINNMASGSGQPRPEHARMASALSFLGVRMETLVYKICV